MSGDTLEDVHVSCEELKDNTVKSSQLTSTNSIISTCSIESYAWKSIVNVQRQQIIDSNWGGYALDLDLWEDDKSPVVQVRPRPVTFDNKECCGLLSDRLIGIGSSFLTRSTENGLYIIGKCVLRNKNLTDITMLRYHRYLQYVDVAYNDISYLSALSDLAYLMYLNASHNKIEQLSNFTPPWYLTHVNLSYNHMMDIGDLRHCWSIVRLNLSHNVIENITGLEDMKHLQYLNLSYNLIECITNLDDLNIQELNLEGNCITSFKSAVLGRGINTLPNLRIIKLGHNRLSTLEFLKDAYSLRFVDLKFNKIANLLEVLNLRSSIFEVDFRGNTCTKWPNYRNALISFMSNIKFIDGIEVFEAEKVTSAMIFASPLDLIASRKAAKLMLLEQLNINRMDAHVQPYDEVNPPLMILTGPLALKKMAMALQVARTIPDKIKYCRWHTTKEIHEDDDDECHAYIFVNREEFNKMTRHGEFLVILDLLGDSYGFHVSQISPLISENKIGLTQMNLYAATEISKRYPNVRAILVLTHSVDLHRDLIREKFGIYTWIKDSVENLLAIKIGKRREDKPAETASCILNFIEEILDEIMCRLEFPTYSINIRPQGERVTTTDIISESKTMLPRLIQRSQIESQEKKRILFTEVENKKYFMKPFDRAMSKEKHAVEELKVILDEKSNIIIHDEATKREMRRSRMMHRRGALARNASDGFDNNDLRESTSSEEETTEIKKTTNEGKEERLQNTYVELVVKTRKMYLDYHETHPGFFTLVLFIDDYTEAFNTLIDFIRESSMKQSYRKPVFLTEMEYIKQTVTPTALENIINEIKENLSISKLQRKTILKMQETAS